MIKKLSFTLTTILFCSFVAYSQVPPPSLQPGEVWTNLYSAAYDYQTNGSVRYIIQDPNDPMQLCAIMMALRDSTLSCGPNPARNIFFSYSDDGGLTWSDPAPAVNPSATSGGFPSLAMRLVGSNYAPIVALHQTVSGQIETHVYIDSPWGNYTFSDLTASGFTREVGPIWPHVTGTSNGNIVFAAAPTTTTLGTTFQCYHRTLNGTTWMPWDSAVNMGGPSGNFSVEAGTNGRVAIFGEDYNGNDANHWKLSTDNGLTWADQTNLPEFIISPPENDTLGAWIDGGKSCVFVGDEPHYVFSVYSNRQETISGQTNYYPKSRIYHWSPSGGLSIVASKQNIPNLADTITTALMTPTCQPSIGRTARGTLVVTFTAFLWGNTQVVANNDVLNAGEIMMTYSTDNGATWATPVNITQTPSIEEKHSSLVRHMNYGGSGNNDSVRVFYLRDMLAGGCVNVAGWGKAPMYGIFKRTGVPLVPIGIKEELEVVRQYQLFQNYPNPFNPYTTISYHIAKPGHVILKIIDVLGREVMTVVDKEQKAGPYEIYFDGSNLASGIYYYTITSGDFRDTKKMVLVK
jgi:hypothetical protein